MWQYKYSDELYHWKYIHKEKVNGKWRYYYEIDDFKNDVKAGVKDALGFDEKARLEVTKAGYDEAAANKKLADQAMTDIYPDGKPPKPGDTRKNTSLGRDLYDSQQAFKEYQRREDIHRQREKAYEDAARAYAKTPLAKIEKAAEAGKKFLNALFGKG